MQKLQGVLITGGSSGIGSALAEYYAKLGFTIFITGRNQKKLDIVSEKCKKYGVNVVAKVVDVTNKEAMEEFIKSSHSICPISIIIANAGVSHDTSYSFEDKNSYSSTMLVTKINTEGVLNTVFPAIDIFKKQGFGQIALMASMASFFGLKGAASYSASKSWVRSYGESIRLDLAPIGIKVSVVAPGFVESEITKTNKFKMPFFMSGEKAAKIIAYGLSKNRALIAFPFQMRLSVWFLNVLPMSLRHFLINFLPTK